MPKNDNIQHSILIVSASEQFNAIVKRSLAGFITIDIRKSAQAARRCVLERYYELIVINSPLPDETGEALALDVSEKYNSSVLMVTPQEVYEDALQRVTDNGVLAIYKPFPRGRLDVAIRFLIAMQNRLHGLEKKNVSVEEKMEEIRIVSKAKLLLVEKKHMSEDEAHRFIGRQAMNNGVSRRKVAEKILSQYSDQD